MSTQPEHRWSSRKLLIGTLTVQAMSAAVIIATVFFPQKEREIRTISEALAPVITTVVALLASAASGVVYMKVEGALDEQKKKSEGEVVVAAIKSDKSPREIAMSTAAVNQPPVTEASPVTDPPKGTP